MTKDKQPEITLPKAHREIGGCEDILRGHCKEHEPHTNGRFLTEAQAREILADPSKAIEIFTGRKDNG